MRFFAISCAAILSAGIAGPSLAGENCTCRGNGQDIPEGQTVCLKTASGMKLARCERVLNNTSWKILDGDCPTAALSRPSPAVADRS
ncbi:MAG: hypothetical protein Kow0026_07840 [Oricola sp.]